MSGSFDIEGMLSQAAQGKLAPPPAPSSSFPIVAPHLAPDNPNALTNLSDADYAKFMAGVPPSRSAAPQPAPSDVTPPSGSAPFDVEGLLHQAAKGQLKYTPPPPQGSTAGGMVRNFAARANDAIFGAIGAPVDLASGAINLGLRGANAAAGSINPLLGAQPPPAVAPQIQEPVGGSDWLKTQFGRVSIDPRAVQPHGEAERVAGAVGSGVASVPMMALGGAGALRALPGASPVVQNVIQSTVNASGPAAIAPVAVGAAVGQGAEDAVPEPWKPVANVVGNVAGAVGGQGLLEGAYAAGRGIGQQAGMMGVGRKQTVGGVPVTGAQMRAAGNQVAGALGEKGQQILASTGEAEARAQELEAVLANPPSPQAAAAAQQELNTLRGQREIYVPGSQPTLGQLVPTPGTVSLEKAHRVASPESFMSQAQEQNRARTNLLQGQAPSDAKPGAVGQFFIQQLDALENAGQARIGQAQRGAQAATERLGGAASPEAYGGEVRGALAAPNTAAKAREGALWEAIDPDGTLALPLGGVQQTARELLADLRPGLGDSVDAAETQILQGAAGLPAVVRFSDAQRLRSNIGTAERRLRGTPGNDQSLRRLGLLKQSLDGAIQDAAEHAAAGDPGVAERLQAVKEAIDGASAGRGSGEVPPNGPGGGTVGGAGAGGGGGQGERRRGSAPSPGAVATGAAIEERGRQPESIADFLIARGGVSDPTGDLKAVGADAIHHRAAGRLINPRGLSPDYARELLEGEGFLRPGSTIADYYNAVGEQASGRPVYRPGEQAEGDMRGRMDREGNRNDAAYAVARNNVTDASIDGPRLSPTEVEHATQLVMQGVHPDDAIREAVRGTEETVLDRHAQSSAFGLPGVPAGAPQTELPVGRPVVTSNFDPEAAARYAAARAATLDRKTTFGQGPVGATLRRGANGAEFHTETAAVPRLFLSGGPVEPASVRRYIDAVGGAPQAVESMRGALVNDLREKGIIQLDGTIKPDEFRLWQHRRSRTIGLFPGLSDGFATAAAAQETLDTTRAAHTQALKEFERSAAASFIRDDPMVAVSRAFKSSNPAETFGGLVRAVRGNPDAEAGLRRAVVDFIAERLTSTAPAGTDDMDFLKADTFRRFIRANSTPLKTVFGGQGLQNFDAVAADLRRQAQGTTATAGSDTTQKLLGVHAAGLGPKVAHGSALTALAIVGEQIGEHTGLGLFVTLASAVALPAAGELLHTFRQAGIKTANDLVQAALRNPSVARELMARTQGGKIGPVAAQRIARALQAAMASDVVTSQEKRR